MKKVKNYIDPEQAKKKLQRYNYWSIKDENGILICSSNENNPDGRSFSEILDKILEDNVDAEIQIRVGPNEHSSRQNHPFFIRVNENIQWVDPEESQGVSVNGVRQLPDRSGRLNINLQTGDENQKIERAEEYFNVKDLMESRLDGLREENRINEQRLLQEMQNKLSEQNLRFQEMLIQKREEELSKKAQQLEERQAELQKREQQIQQELKSYLKQVPNVLGSLLKQWFQKESPKDLQGANLENDSSTTPPKQNPVDYTVLDEDSPENTPPENTSETNHGNTNSGDPDKT